MKKRPNQESPTITWTKRTWYGMNEKIAQKHYFLICEKIDSQYFNTFQIL